MPIDPKATRWADTEFKAGNYQAAAEKIQYGLLSCIDDVEARKKLRAIGRKNRIENPPSGLAKIKHQAKLTKLRTVLSTKKTPKEYIEEAEKYLFEDPNNVEIALEMADNFNKMEMYSVSDWILEDLTRLEPKNPAIWKQYGNICKDHLGKIEEAKKCFAMVQKLDPKDVEVGKLLRQIEAENVTASGATTARDSLLDEEETLRREVESRVIRNAEDARAHVKYLLQDLEKSPENGKLMEKIADRYRQGGLYKEAIEWLEKALAKDTTNQTIRMRIGDVRQQRVTNQIQKLETLLERDPSNKEVQTKLKKARLVELKTGLETYQGRVEAFPNDLTIKQTYGEYLFKAKKYKEALGQFQKAISDPKVADPASEYLARSFIKLGKHKMALKPLDFCIGKTIAKSERWKELLYTKAQCLQEMGEQEEATKLFEEIYEVDINFKDVVDLI